MKNSSKKTILITGAAGFLGYHLTRALQSQNVELILGDIAPFAADEYGKNHTLLNLDIRDKNAVLKAARNADAIIHAAAALPLTSAHTIHETNVTGTRNILIAARETGVEKVVYISSTAVYGVPKKHPIEETDPRVGVGAYGISKIAAEDLCMDAGENGLPITILRPKTFVGTGRLGVFEILFDWIHDGKRIPVIGNGTNRYQLLEVDDLVSAITYCIMRTDSVLNDVFNVGAERYQTVKEDLEALFKAAESTSHVMPTPAALVKTSLRIFEALRLSPLYQWVYETADKDSFVSVEKLKKATPWSAQYSNREALIKAYTWYQDHYTDVKRRKSGTTHTVSWHQGILGILKKIM